MTDLPSTIRYPETFNDSPAAGFDGVFDWSFTAGCFGPGNITPMDFDGVVERKGNFIIFETKAPGTPVPAGQIYTYKSAYEIGCFTVVFIEGKRCPEAAKVWCQPGFKTGSKMKKHAPTNPERMREFVSCWYEYADKNPRQKINTEFLNKRIFLLESKIDLVKKNLVSAVNAIGGKVTWGK